MGSLIRVLPDLLINQIAAGEVIEDPASVVKELIENALDAGARCIDVELVAGGHRLIRVSDDGRGMSGDDAVLCFERHATSKIHDQKDLESFLTMGFRGEALAAIAAISKVTLQTSMSQDLGVLVDIQGGKLIKVHPCARSRGTTIEVRDLFYNTPARRKFQKNHTAASTKIERWIEQFSLGYPQIEFSLKELEKTRQFPRYEQQNFLEILQWRMADVYGQEFSKQQMKVEAEDTLVSLQGYISPPEQHRPQRSGQVLFINGRLVQSPAVGHAIKEAYSTRLPEGRHPLFLIHCTLPPYEIDVNVHPQKKEVRFRQEERVKQCIRQGVLQALERGKEYIRCPGPVYVNFNDSIQLPWMFMESKCDREFQPVLPLPSVTPKVIALFSQYVFIEGSAIPAFGQGVAIVDLQKAVERIMYDNSTSKQASLATQRLLIPLNLSVSKQEAAELRDNIDVLKSLGITIAEMGERVFSIEEIPAAWDSEQVVNALFLFLAEEQKTEPFQTFRRCIKTTFLLQEAEGILLALLRSPQPLKTPLGHPIMVYLEENGLRRLFTHAQS
ncbi:MAG: DNA mismatch repair endonuclease MutL [Simkania sp.]|nr:DNA mismatch repair endonuclease MutL [Simkania sp.]